MRNQNSIIYSEYTLNKFKNYLLKHIDRIDINYDVIYLYKKYRDDFERIKYNQQLIDYILNDNINFYKIEKNIIINLNMIEYASVHTIESGPYGIALFNWCLEIDLPSDSIKIVYDDSSESYDFLEKIRKKIYPYKKIKFTIFEKIFLVSILIIIIKLFCYLLNIKLF